MTQSFDEWYFDAKQHNTDGFTNREFYEAGAASRQAEIDELRKRNEQAIAYIEHWHGCVELSNIVDILNGDMNWENNQ